MTHRKLIPVYVTLEQYALAKELAGQRTLSGWARDILFPPTQAQVAAREAGMESARKVVDVLPQSGSFEAWLLANGLGAVKYGHTAPSVSDDGGPTCYATIDQRIDRIVAGAPCSACGYGRDRASALADFKRQLAGLEITVKPYKKPRVRIQCPAAWDEGATT